MATLRHAAICIPFIISGFSNYLPRLRDPDPTPRGMHNRDAWRLWAMAFLVLRYPLQVLPIFLFEFVWKTMWLLSFGLPHWWAGWVDSQLSKDLWEMGSSRSCLG